MELQAKLDEYAKDFGLYTDDSPARCISLKGERSGHITKPVLYQDLTPAYIDNLREAYALCMLQKEGIKSGDKELQEKIALLTFERYPFMFRLSMMSQWYLRFMKNKYDPAYIFVRCCAYQGRRFNYKNHIKSDCFFAERESSIVAKATPIKSIFGKLKKRKRCLIVQLPDNQGELALPLECEFSAATVAKLGLISPNLAESAFRNIFRAKGDLHANEPYYTIEIHKPRVEKVIPTV